MQSPFLPTNYVNNKLRVLFVDDSPLDLQVLLSNLSDEFEVIFSLSATEAIFFAQQLPQPDIILLDIFMPDIDGFQLCRKLTEHPSTKHIPIIFLSSNTSTRIKTRAFNLGCVDFMSKPVDPVELALRIKLHTKLNRQSQEIENLPALHPVTNLYNNNYYIDEFYKEWMNCKRFDYPLTLMHCAIDDFAELTELHGHYFKQSSAQAVANVLRKIGNRPGDIVAHIDDAYFAIVLSDSHLSYSAGIAKEIIASISEAAVLIHSGGASTHITVSIGIAAIYPDDNSDYTLLHKNAEQALADAQSMGGNMWSMDSDISDDALLYSFDERR